MTAFPNQTYNMLGSILFSVQAAQPYDWSGTNIPGAGYAACINIATLGKGQV